MKTPDEWAAEHDVLILDPDGWRRDGKPWDEPLTEEDFLDRMAQSTICSPRANWGGFLA